MNILAIDLGHLTGYVLLKNEAMHSHGVVPLESVATSMPGPPDQIDLVVIERPAYREAPFVQERYEETIRKLRLSFGDKVKTVRPADWMPRFIHHPLPERGVLTTRHEKDAYRIARWAQDKYAAKD